MSELVGSMNAVRCWRCGYVSPEPPDDDIECCWKGPDWQRVLIIPIVGDGAGSDGQKGRVVSPNGQTTHAEPHVRPSPTPNPDATS